jgi:outer membrane protein insertion porin family
MHWFKRGFWLGLILIPALTLSFAGETLAQKPDKASAKSAASGTRPAATKKIRILVLPFAVHAGPELGDVAKSLPELLADKLRELGLTPVDAKTTAAVIKAGKVKSIDAAEAQSLAKAAKASYAVYGAFNQVGEDLSLDARLVDASGKKKPQQLTGSAKGIINVKPAVDSLAASIAESATSGAGQVPSKEAGKDEIKPGEKIAAVAVEGNVVLDKDVVLLKVKSQPGDAYDPRTVNEDLKRLYDLGFFEDVQIRVDDVPGGKKLVFVIKEKPKIMAIGVVGSTAIDKDDITAAMTTKTGSVLNLKTVSEDLAKIRELFVKKGYYNVDVSYKLEQTDPRQARLDIVVKETGKLFIKSIEVKGCKQLSASDAKGELSLSERGFLSWITGSGVLKEDQLERDVAALESFYANRGFIDVRVGQPDVQFKPDGIYITFTVEEGNRYKVGTVSFKGDLLVSPEELAKHSKLATMSKSKDWFDRSMVRSDLNALTEYYSDQGFAYCQADMDIQKVPGGDTVDVTYILNKGPKVYVRRVLIEGNERTRDNVIRRELRLADGDQFSGSKMKRSQERLNKLDYFDKIDIDPVPTNNPQEMDLKVTVKDKNTGSFNIGGGYSTSDAVFAGGSIEEKNLFGKGYNASISGMIGGKASRYVLRVANPKVYDSDWFTVTELYNTYQRYDNFNKSTTGGAFRVGHPLGEFTEAAAEYRLDFYDITNVNFWESPYIWASRGNRIMSSAEVYVSRDTTDSKSRPTKGTIFKLSDTYSGGLLGGDDEFDKLVGRGDYYLTTFLDQVFHMAVQGGVLLPTGPNRMPIFERFSLGGISSIRGYEVNKVSPRDPVYGQRIGGEVEAFTNLEYIVPINKANGVYGLGFFDAGNAWLHPDVVDTTLYKAVGAGIRWYSPMGMFRVEYGYGLDAQAHHLNPSQIGFSMGQTF